jgi:hypothetical protein
MAAGARTSTQSVVMRAVRDEIKRRETFTIRKSIATGGPNAGGGL